MYHNIIEKSSFYSKLKKKFGIIVLMESPYNDNYHLYFNSNTDFIEIKKFILDYIPNVKTVKLNEKYGLTQIHIKFLYDKEYK